MLVGINGFGRIGKCIFLQYLESYKKNEFQIRAINIPDLDKSKLEVYLKNDSIQHYNNHFKVEIKDDILIIDDIHYIYLLSNRNPELLNWKQYGINYVIESSGVFLTKEKAELHHVDYVMMCAPPKDKEIPQYIYNVNHQNYQGENYISNASCTTNCITPLLKVLNDEYKVLKGNFTTIHATTASQYTTDTTKFKNRTNRGILNNIIPHTTGASSSIFKVIPELQDKIDGTSLRVPVSNVSIVDLNIILETKTDLSSILDKIKSDYPYIQVNQDNLVSSDFITTECPTIIDKNACIDMKEGHFKFMIWYDNEWSYSSQTIKLLNYMIQYNLDKKRTELSKYYLSNIDKSIFKDKNIVLRVDWNVPFDKEYQIQDFYRIDQSLTTIKYLLDCEVNKIYIVSHLGRPDFKNKEDRHMYSWNRFIDQIYQHINMNIMLIDKLEKDNFKNISQLGNNNPLLIKQNKTKLYLLENIRLIEEEQKYAKMSQDEIEKNEMIQFYLNLGDIYINDAFGCSHRNHMSITSSINKKPSLIGLLIEKELGLLNKILNSTGNHRVLSVIGGAKMDDKIPLLSNLSKKVDTIYLVGGNINSYLINNQLLDNFINNKSSVILMKDGLYKNYENLTLKYYNLETKDKKEIDYLITNTKNKKGGFLDVGILSILELSKLIESHDIIFWNGPLGYVEEQITAQGSIGLTQLLIDNKKKEKNKTIIIGGGDTGSFVNKFKNHNLDISTGGGASLEYLSQGYLTGLIYPL